MREDNYTEGTRILGEGECSLTFSLQMLLCDSCDRECHMYCLYPKLWSVPRGKWVCPHCNEVSLEWRDIKVEKRVMSDGMEQIYTQHHTWKYAQHVHINTCGPWTPMASPLLRSLISLWYRTILLQTIQCIKEP